MWRQDTACPALKSGQGEVAGCRRPPRHCHKCGGPQGCGRGLTWVASAKLSVRLSHRTHGVTDQECPNSSLCCFELSPAQGPGPRCHHRVTHHGPDPCSHPPQPRPPPAPTTAQTPTVTHHIPDPPVCTLDPPGHPSKSGHPSHYGPLLSPTAAHQGRGLGWEAVTGPPTFTSQQPRARLPAEPVGDPSVWGVQEDGMGSSAKP